MATHVNMHRSPGCSVEIGIEIEKELEKRRKMEKPKKPSDNN